MRRRLHFPLLLTLVLVLRYYRFPEAPSLPSVVLTRPAAAIRAAEPPHPTSAPESLDAYVREASRTYAVPDTLIHAVIHVESAGNTRAVSPKGAQGLMQLMPETAAALGVRDPFDPRDNVLAGTRYLRFLLNAFDVAGF